jgi:hypothetical protein
MLNDERMCTFIAKSRLLAGLIIDGPVRIMTGCSENSCIPQISFSRYVCMIDGNAKGPSTDSQ